MCGFANASGGKLYIGIDIKGKVTGIDNHNKLLEELPNKFRDILGVYAEVNLQEEKGKRYLEIIVPRYDVPIAVRGKYYVRTGSTLQEISGLALNEFILKRTGKTWGDIPEQRASINDIEACKEYGLPEPVLKEEQGGFLSIVFKSTVKSSGKVRGR